MMSDKNEHPARKAFRPSEIMRERHPELFSDSENIDEPHISPEAFELQLELLTTKKRELDFESFCRRLAEKELCPNLLPQTGPTGGGDSKVDSETYPVAEELACRWYEGSTTAASQRWGFAFSAKKKWREKIKSDIRGIAKTGRPYKQIYFITNQYVKDKDRANVEAELERETKIPLRILDRTWILKCVFENERLAIAVESLHLSKATRPAKSSGPEDAKREIELQELEAQIADHDRYKGVEYQLAEDCLRAALFARGLERPRSDVEGRLDRALRIADQVGNRAQRLRITYNKAWTAYWWFEDYSTYWTLYQRVEELAAPSDQSNELELLLNLWALLRVCVASGNLQAAEARIADRTKALKNALSNLGSDGSRPNNALWARTNLAIMNLTESGTDKSKAAPVFKELQGIIEQIKGLVDYPLEAVVDILDEIGKHYTDSPEYDSLLDSIVLAVQKRHSDSAAGELLLKRGFQMLESKKSYEAIRLFGRAQSKLGVRESRGRLVAALAGCAAAFEAVGLYWAARAKLLSAANQTLSEFSEHGLILPQSLVCLKRLVWLELRLGRVTYAARWMEALRIVARHLKLNEQKLAVLREEYVLQDRAMGSLILKSSLQDLGRLDYLPEHFEGLNLDYSWMALLYALGYEEHLRAETAIPASETKQAVLEFFLGWLNVPANKEFPKQPEYFLDKRILLRTRIIGCEVIVEVENDHLPICLAERILGSCEALLATSVGNDVVAHRPEFRINLLSALDKSSPDVEFDDSTGQGTATVRYTNGVTGLQEKDWGWLSNLLLGILARIAVIRDVEQYMDKVLGDEDALNRALNFSETAVPIRNILSKNPKLRTLEWKSGTEKLFPLQRSAAWFAGHIPKKEPSGPMRPGKGPIPNELKDSEWKHNERRVLSVINMPLWDRAGWRATGYITAPGQPPMIALSFEDGEAAKLIFKEWLVSFGKVDEKECLRISIITGLNKNSPHRYKVAVGANLPEEQDDAKQIVSVARINQMDPTNSANLDRFRAAVKDIGGYYFIVPARFNGSTFSMNDIFLDHAICKRSLAVREAWKIEEHDPDLMVLTRDDDPIIPKDIIDPPVLKALARIRREKEE